jgi:hypothetical protein
MAIKTYMCPKCGETLEAVDDDRVKQPDSIFGRTTVWGCKNGHRYEMARDGYYLKPGEEIKDG